MKKYLHILLFFAFISVDAQDLHYSHFMQAPMQRGAGEAGNFNGDLRLTALMRRQWASVTTPYRTMSLAGDGRISSKNMHLQRLSAGVQINYDRAGDGDLTQLQVLAAFSYRIPVTSDSIHFIRAGIQGGIVQRSLDFNSLTFDNQFNGDVFDPMMMTGENFGEDQQLTGDFGFSFGWTGIADAGMLDAGFQVMHLNRAQWTFLNDGDAKYPLLYQFTLAAQGKNENAMQIKPALTYMKQDENSELNGGAEFQFNLKEKPVRAWAFSLAAFYRWKDAIIPQVALYYDKFRFGLSYDVNISGLNKVSNYKGGPEISIVYIARRIKAPQNSSVCPVY